MKLAKYSFGIGDRFGHQCSAQLAAITKAMEQDVQITPVWNKSYREHQIIRSSPVETRQGADRAVQQAGWERGYFVDADHINLTNVDEFLEHSDFFTIDVAEFIGQSSGREVIEAFVNANSSLVGSVVVRGITDPFPITEAMIRQTAGTYLRAISEVERVYRCITVQKNIEDIVIEVSMDEVEKPQTPVELLFILKMLADRNIQLQTIALKFSGRFNKGVDYVGDIREFVREFEQDLLVIDYAVREFGLPEDLKLSIHSGSDKFSLYKPINRMLNRHGKGIHVKTAGTTWLEELIGLALAGGDGLQIVKKIYEQALHRFDELTDPYDTVTDICKSKLPILNEVDNWSGEKFANTLRHDPDHPDFNSHFRQLLHCAYKIAAEFGEEYTDALKANSEIISANVTENLYSRHIEPLFL